MKLGDLYKNKKHLFSFEIFPPKQSTGFSAVRKVVDELCNISPDFISVTYGAGGSVKNNHTVEICDMVKRNGHTEPVAHLTCVGATKSEIDCLLSQLREHGVTNILALRGDKNPAISSDGDFRYASQLIEYIKEKHGDTFNVLAACYPAGHSDSPTQKEDIKNLCKKVQAGASQLITQMFFDNEEFYRFRDLIDVAGIEVPVEAGIMPITNSRQIEKVIALSGATIPSRLAKLIARYGQNDEAMFEAGIAYAIEQIVELLSSDINGIHLYTMNNPAVATRIYQAIKGLLKL